MPFSLRPSRRFPLTYFSGFMALLTLLVLSSEPVYAEWMSVSGYNKAGMTVYVDSDTIRRKGDLVKMWELGDFKTSQRQPSGLYLSFKRHSEYDCTHLRSRLLAVKSYSGNMGSGKVVLAKSAIMQWIPFLPGSVEQDLWKFACGKK